MNLSYDAAGNLTDDGDKVYEYEVLGRLTLVKSSLNSNVSLAAYRYEGLDLAKAHSLRSVAFGGVGL